MATITPGRRRHGNLERKEARAGLFFVLPWLLSLLLFTAYPVLASVYFSFTDYNIIEAPKWVGLSNFQTMFTADPDFLTGVGNSAYYAFISVPLGLILSLALALLLNTRARGIGLYRTLFYLPALCPPVAATIVFILMLDPDAGLINNLLTAVGLGAPGWLSDPGWSKPSLILLSLWTVGSGTLIFLAGLKEVPQTLIEAASIDGAGPLRRFSSVTLPLLTPVILFNLVMGVINSFQVFTQALVIGGTTGDPLGSTLMFMVLIYSNAFSYFKMGYASALSIMLFLAVVILTLLIFRTSRAWVYYEGGTRS